MSYLELAATFNEAAVEATIKLLWRTAVQVAGLWDYSKPDDEQLITQKYRKWSDVGPDDVQKWIATETAKFRKDPLTHYLLWVGRIEVGVDAFPGYILESIRSVRNRRVEKENRENEKCWGYLRLHYMTERRGNDTGNDRKTPLDFALQPRFRIP